MRPEAGRTGSARDPWIDRLSEYLDGELATAERQAVDAHLAGCERCSSALAELRAVVARAHALEDAPPAEDLWPGIAARIAAGAAPHGASPARARSFPDAGRPWWARRLDLSMPQVAAAALLLTALSAGAMWLALRDRRPPPVPAAPDLASHGAPARSAPGAAPASSTPAATTASDPGVDAAPALATLSNPRYDAAVAELEQALAEGRGRLDPRTLRVVEENLRIIDRALDDARRAVAADPGNVWLRSHLAATMIRKVDLLRSATLLASAQG